VALTHSQLVTGLTQLGITPGEVVIFHASLRTLGPVIGGSVAVLNALQQAVGAEGTLAAYLDFEAFYEEDDPEIPAYDKRTAPAARDHGVLHEAFRTWPGTEVSDHPGARVAANGPLADHLLNPHPAFYGYGPGTPFERLYEANAKILMLGAPLDTITMLHYAEHLANIPGKRILRYRRLIATPQGPQYVDFEEFDTGDPVHPALPENCFEQIALSFLATGQGRQSAMGHLFESKSLIPFAVEWIETHIQTAESPGETR